MNSIPEKLSCIVSKFTKPILDNAINCCLIKRTDLNSDDFTVKNYFQVSEEIKENENKFIIENRILDWKKFNENPFIKIDFNFLEKYASQIDWRFIDKEYDLIWDIENIGKFSKHLIWKTTKENFDTRKDYHIGFSSFKNINWSSDLIQKFSSFFDWSELSLNNSVPWNEDWIAYFEKKIDFKGLSLNPSVIWTESLIEKFINNWNWEYLSGNPSLPWSNSFIAKYENRWTWIPKYFDTIGWKYDDDAYRFIKFFEVSKLNPSFDKYYDESFADISSISTNAGITWNVEDGIRWKEQINFWLIALHGKITFEFVKANYLEFYRERSVKWVREKICSDQFNKFFIYRSGWENLNLNKNFIISKNEISFYWNLSIEVEEIIGENPRERDFVKKIIRVFELLSNCKFKGLELDDLIVDYEKCYYEFDDEKYFKKENQYTWLKNLINENYINESIWEDVIKPHFTIENLRADWWTKCLLR